MSNSGWDQVTQKTIANCFRKSSLCYTEDTGEDAADTEIVTTEWEDKWEDIQHNASVHYEDKEWVQPKFTEIQIPKVSQALNYVQDLIQFVEGRCV